MTAPSTFTATGTWYHPDGSLASGEIHFKSTVARFKSNSNIINRQVTVAVLSSGAISQTLVQSSSGYEVTEHIIGLDGVTRAYGPYHIAGTSNLSITA